MISLQALKALNFLKKKHDLIGIDIGTHAIKLVCLKRTSSQWSLVRWGIIPYAEDIPLDTPLSGTTHASGHGASKLLADR